MILFEITKSFDFTKYFSTERGFSFIHTLNESWNLCTYYFSTLFFLVKSKFAYRTNLQKWLKNQFAFQVCFPAVIMTESVLNIFQSNWSPQRKEFVTVIDPLLISDLTSFFIKIELHTSKVICIDFPFFFSHNHFMFPLKK